MREDLPIDVPAQTSGHAAIEPIQNARYMSVVLARREATEVQNHEVLDVDEEGCEADAKVGQQLVHEGQLQFLHTARDVQFGRRLQHGGVETKVGIEIESVFHRRDNLVVTN